MSWQSKVERFSLVNQTCGNDFWKPDMLLQAAPVHTCLYACVSTHVHESALSNPTFPTEKKNTGAMCHAYAL